ncbi:MAG: CvpA family protein [Erysipelotrichaceae bacterium]|nr:CvpA family protein [Erysipelotrichaceae bacterium]MBQ6494115.1 CvpA family protein [Erysipelotrichaceae bacterium]
MKKKNKGIYLIMMAIVLAILLIFCQYMCCIPLNLHSPAFVIELLFIALIVFLFLGGFITVPKEARKRKFSASIGILSIIISVFFIAVLIGTPYTGGLSNYRDQSPIREIDFEQIEEFDPNQVQLVDKNTAVQLGDRVFGTLGSDEVSQYDVGDDWVQIVLNDSLFRVTPIDFGGMFKYLITRTTPGYIMVDCESGDAKLVRSEGMRYMTSAYFNDNLQRHLFFKDPTAIFGSPKFELDDNQKPYWVTPVYDVTWVGKTRDIKGIYITDPVSGKSDYYDNASAPKWVDNIYPVSLVYTQFMQSKKYENGLFNWSNKGVVEFTDDYAYVQFDHNVCIYTGVTSVGKDESNVGFAYVNLRNGEVSYIRRAGAEEYSARSSAEGAVQQYHYTAIFPSMVNVKGVPTYFMGLVDGANLIKNYAFVSYENYQTVAVGKTVEEAYNNYLKLIGETDTPVDSGNSETTLKHFTVDEVRIIVKDGNSIVLMKDSEGKIYWYDLSGSYYAASFIHEGDLISANVTGEGKITDFISITPVE